MRIVLIITVLSALLGTGCATRIPMTADLKVEFKLSDEDMKSMYYYVSDDVHLKVTHTQKETGREGTALGLKKATQEKDVDLSRFTQGIAVNVTQDMLEISFEEDSSFKFRNKAPSSTNSTVSGNSKILDYWLEPDRKGDKQNEYIYIYKGEEYIGPPPNTVRLEVKKNSKNLVSKQRKRLPGRKLDETGTVTQ